LVIEHLGLIDFSIAYLFRTVIILLVKPIHDLLKKYLSFSCTNDVENSFVNIKKEICFAPVLAKLNFEKEFIMYANATEEVVSSILI